MRFEIYSPSHMSRSASLEIIYETLYSTYGPRSWWPADTPFEVMLGAILTQNTAWTNVEKALAGLKEICELTPKDILSLPLDRLQAAIRFSGYFRQKADRLRGFSRYLMDRYGGDLATLEPVPTAVLREELLALNGIGPETADSILLYALDRPVFVVDAYTVRLFSRLGLCIEKGKYDDVQALFMSSLDPDAGMFNEYHALIVLHCKQKCKKREPECNDCALANLCAFNLKSQIIS